MTWLGVIGICIGILAIAPVVALLWARWIVYLFEKWGPE